MFKNKKEVKLFTYAPDLLTTEVEGSITATYERNTGGDKSSYLHIAVSKENVFLDLSDDINTEPYIVDMKTFLGIDAREIGVTFEVIQYIVQDLLAVLQNENDYLLGYRHMELDKSFNIHKYKPTKFPLSEIPRNVYSEEEYANLRDE